MTTSGRARTPAHKRAAAPEGQREVRAGIERTRQQLGDTVTQLVAKTDVKGQAKAKAAAVTGRARSAAARARAQTGAVRGKAWERTSTVRGKAWEQTGAVRGKLAGTAAVARQKAASAAKPAAQQLGSAAGSLPEPVRRAASKGAGAVRQHRKPVALAAVTLVAGYLTIRRWRNR